MNDESRRSRSSYCYEEPSESFSRRLVCIKRKTADSFKNYKKTRTSSREEVINNDGEYIVEKPV